MDINDSDNIIIDKNKCNVCGICIGVCGSKTLEIIEKLLVQINPALCCSCGHCAAICPQNAITSNKENSRAFTVNNYNDELSVIEKLLIAKRSVREFTNNEISKKVLENFIYYAEKAPSSSNARKREYIVITDKNKILEFEKAVIGKFNSLKKIVSPFLISVVKLFNKNLSDDLALAREDIQKLNTQFGKGNFPIFRNAASVVFIMGPKGAVQAKDDCVIAQQYMMLYAQSLGIGSCIIGYAQYAHKTIEKVLDIKKGFKIYAVAVFGYPKQTYNKEIHFINTPETTWI